MSTLVVDALAVAELLCPVTSQSEAGRYFGQAARDWIVAVLIDSAEAKQ